MLISSKTTTSESPKGRDNRSATVQPSGAATGSGALADDREDMYGIGYLNPAFDDNNAAGARSTARPGSQTHSLLKHTFHSHRLLPLRDVYYNRRIDNVARIHSRIFNTIYTCL